jgi:hypothetical protein
MFSRTTTEATMMTLTDAETLTGLLESARWKWAHRYAKFAPHYYSLASTWTDPDAFVWCVAAIQRLGIERPFKSRTFTYFTAGDWDYWCYDGAIERELINRARRKHAATITP